MFSSMSSFVSDNRGGIVLKGVLAGVITIIVFSSIVGIFIITTGEDVNSGHPNVQAQVSYDDARCDFVVTHNGGNTVTGQNTRTIKITGDTGSFTTTSKRVNVGQEFTTGDVLFEEQNVSLEPGDSVAVLLIAQEDGSEVPIGRYEV